MQDSVVKGGVCWFEMSINRTPGGTEFYFKSVPELEKYVASFGDGSYDLLDAYGREWLPIGNDELKVYRIKKDVPGGSGYTFNKVAEPLGVVSREGIINLSFLRLVGIGSPTGVRFSVPGPSSKSGLKQMSEDTIDYVKKFIQDYIIPVHLNLRISSLES